MHLRLAYSATETPNSKKKMLRCATLWRTPTPSLASHELPPLEKLRKRRPDLAVIVDGIVNHYLEDTE
jgi:hypothetical protein